MPEWIAPFAKAAVMVPFMIACVRLAGLRSFSKMSSYDFAVTVAFGSTLAGTVLNPGTALWQGLLAMTALFGVQWVIGIARSRFEAVQALTDNNPVLLMRDGRVLEGNMRDARVTRAELTAKLREANALDPSQVRAVVLETTGDVSVLHGDRLDDTILQGVRRTTESSPDRNPGPLDA
jgi:uncharacterized membrane protein YcaP (DUF421 family)